MERKPPGLPKPSYWAARAEDRMLDYERSATQTVDVIRRAYQRAQKDIERDTLAIFRNFQRSFGLTEDEARFQLAQPVSRAEYKALLRRIAQIEDPALRLPLEARASSGAYGYRLERQVALRLNLDAQVTRLAEIERATDTSFFEQLVPEAYSRAIFDIQRGTGLQFSFTPLNNQATQAILRNPWSGNEFSSLIWGRTQKLAEELNERITSAFLTGRSAARVSSELAVRMQVTFHKAERLVRTEMNYMANAAEMRGYTNIGMQKYRFIATLDNRTSAICQELDQQVFWTEDAVPGKNMPPMHPNCRSTTVAVIDDDALEGLKRRAIRPDGTVEYVPGDMTYKEWKEKIYLPIPTGNEVRENGLAALKNGHAEGIMEIGRPTGAKKTPGWKERHADRFYEEVRHRTTDVKKIAANTIFTEKAVEEIKQHVFFKEHDLGDGIVGRFATDFDQAQAWDRLMQGKYTELDVILLKHEYVELTQMRLHRYDYDTAHRIANKHHDWGRGVKEKENEGNER